MGGVQPLVETIIPASGSVLPELFSIEIQFQAPVRGVEAADLLVNGVATTNVTEVAPGQFLFLFPQPLDGVVSVSWRADHGITDAVDTSQAFAGGTWTYQLESAHPPTDLQISEFMADNHHSLHDEDGDSSDWIELLNAGENPASLEGWFLTDDPGNLTKWRFPDVTLPERGCLVVFASEKDRTNATGRLHTNFKLSSDGDYLALVSPATNVVSEFAPAYPKQFTDVAYGRAPGAPQALGYFSQPTPGAPNASSGSGFAPEVEYSRQSGTFTARFDLVLATRTPEATIRYTLDGNLPTNSSPAYVVPIAITNSVQVRSRAFQEGLLPGPPHSETYLLLNSNVLSFASDLPVLVLHTLGRGTPSASRQTFAHVSVYEPVKGVASLTNPPTLATRTGIKIRGASTEGIPKSSFSVELWDEFNQDQDRPMLELPADSDWVLYAPNNFEPVLIHNPFIHQLSRDMGRYSPRTRFVEVYLNKSTGPISAANYYGLYVLEEKIKIGQDRIAIDELQPEHVTPPEVTGGYLLKIDRLDPGDSGFTAGGQGMAYVDPKEREIRLPQRDPQEQYVKNYFNAFGRALNGTNWLDPDLGYAAYIDVEAWIDYHIVEVLSGNVDALVLSTYFHKPRNGKIVFGPHWDFDRALGSTDGRDANPRTWSTGPYFKGWWSRLFRDRDFWQKWIDRYQELRGSHLARANLNALIDRLANEVRQAQPRDTQKWRVALRGGSYQSEVNLMKNWLSNRLDFLDRQLVSLPGMSAGGGTVFPGFSLSLSGPTNATIFYTLDGSDPRLPQGEVSPLARAWPAPITLTANARVVARARNLNQRQTGGPPVSSPWSGPVAATFVVTPPPLLITEIMFHPAPPPAGSTNTASDYEFIELKNVSDKPLSLPGFRLTNGIDYTFTADSFITNLPAGAHLVLVRNLAAFQARYPGCTNVAGEFSGGLGNGGNHLSLLGPLQEPVCDVAYGDQWAALADGFGFSLVLADESTPPAQAGDASRWCLSTRLGGSPGATDPPRPALPRVFVNEVISNPSPGAEDAIELYNNDAVPADLSGWWLTDDFREPRKYRVPQGVRIDGKGFHVFSASDFKAGPSGFGLSALGDEVYVFSAAAAGDLTGWCHGFRFGPQEQGRSFVRWVTSDAREHIAWAWMPSLGEPNSPPGNGPIAILKIMYRPPPLDGADNVRDEFIELGDISFSDVPFPAFDPAHPANTWRVRGDVEFDFAPGFRMPIDRRVVVVGFDAQTDTAALTAFRAHYRLDDRITILGPWRGSLNNTRGTVRLLKPLAPVAPPSPDAGLAPYALVEEVNYLTTAPWPTNANGTGRTIMHRYPQTFGDEPNTWMSYSATPGDSDIDGDGLPSRWETAHGLNPEVATGDDGPDGDPDGDGFTNLQESYAGTDPQDPMSCLSLTAVQGIDGGIRLRFTAAAWRTYTVQYRDQLAQGQWQILQCIAAQPKPTLVEIENSSTNSTRFYRLETP